MHPQVVGANVPRFAQHVALWPSLAVTASGFCPLLGTRLVAQGCPIEAVAVPLGAQQPPLLLEPTASEVAVFSAVAYIWVLALLPASSRL